MILSATRGQVFTEVFTFKNESGKPLPTPAGEYVLTLEHGDFVKEFKNLKKLARGVSWTMTRDDVDALPYATMYYRLTFNGGEITRGVLRVS